MAEFYLAERESAILGQEFLTWLWYAADIRNGLFKTRKGEAFTAFVAQRVSVQGGEGDSKETASVAGPHSELKEAQLGLRTGKKVNKALLLFDKDGAQWQVQVKAEDFGLNSLKTPKIETRREEGEDPDAAFLEKAFLVEQCLEFFDALYFDFLTLRLSPSKWPEEVQRFKEWLVKAER